MLSLSPRYKKIVSCSAHPLRERIISSVPPMPVGAFAFSVIGRCLSKQHIKDVPALLADSLATLQLAASKAAGNPVTASPSWYEEIRHHVAVLTDSGANTTGSVRYISLNDPLYSSAMSRFHCVIKKSVVQAPNGDVLPTYFIKDTGSLNGVYLDDLRITNGDWHKLNDGVRVRFAPISRQTKILFDSILAAPDHLVPALTRTDSVIELEFRACSDAESAALVPSLDPVARPSASLKRSAPEQSAEEEPVAQKAKVEDSSPAAASAASASASPAAAAASSSPKDEPSSLMDEFQCSICSNVILQFTTLTCEHSYCRHCITLWFKKKRQCPQCRTPHRGQLIGSRVADSVIQKLVQENFTEAELAERLALIKTVAKQTEAEEKRKLVAADKRAARLAQHASFPAEMNRIMSAMAAAHVRSEVAMEDDNEEGEEEENNDAVFDENPQ